jgi:two-component system sensor histidine kinase TctE
LKPLALRNRLLLGILLPLAAILALGAWGLYRNALASAQAAFDRQLVSAAHSIADTLRLEGQRMSVSVPYAVLELHAPEPGGVFYHRVTGLEGELLSGDETLPRYRGPVPSAADYTGLVGLYDDQVRDTPVRVAVVYQPVEGHERTGVVPVQVAEPLSNRETMARSLLWQTLATQWVLLLAVALVTVLAVDHALRPLRRLRRELDQRDGQALAPLPEAGSGAELLPVVRALNALMARVRDMLAQQQRFVADAAHQLRTPLAVLQTQLQSGQGGAVDPAVLMREMQGTVQRATALSQQLLALARVQQWHGEVHAGASALGAAAREAALELSPLIARQDLAFSLDLPDGDLVAAIEPWLAGELIRNLLHNAIRHSPPATALGVTVQAGSEPGLPVQWICWDRGPGIAPALRERVFEPFAQTGTATPAGHAPGSGLGLSICRAIVLSCGGQIRLDDHRQEDSGAPGLRVTVSLPAAAGQSVTTR